MIQGFDWVIHEECLAIKRYLEQRSLVSVPVTTSPIGLRNKVVHFLSENTLIGSNGLRYRKGSNCFILTWFHISEADTFRTKYIRELNSEVEFIHTASSITAEKLQKYGADPKRIVKIGLDVIEKYSFRLIPKQKLPLKKNKHFPLEKILLGLFQKDVGMAGDGLEPKLIKGPDIFCAAVEKLSEKYPIHVILTGPAKGYVKTGAFYSLNTPFTHRALDRYEMVADYFENSISTLSALEKRVGQGDNLIHGIWRPNNIHPSWDGTDAEGMAV